MTPAEIAAACENAEPVMQAALIEDAWEVVAPTWPIEKARELAGEFSHKLEARAYLDAAMMMVPDDCLAMTRTLWVNADQPLLEKVGYASIDRYIQDGGVFWKENFLGLASTPALALLSAIMRAQP